MYCSTNTTHLFMSKGIATRWLGWLEFWRRHWTGTDTISM